ncbi:MAG: hypothetical protein ACYDCK_07890 [Thermoplasmatota archaeon]
MKEPTIGKGYGSGVDAGIREFGMSDRRPTRELKTTLPRELVVALHTHKVLTGMSIGAAITVAVEAYFAAYSKDRAEARLAASGIEDVDTASLV